MRVWRYCLDCRGFWQPQKGCHKTYRRSVDESSINGLSLWKQHESDLHGFVQCVDGVFGRSGRRRAFHVIGGNGTAAQTPSAIMVNAASSPSLDTNAIFPVNILSPLRPLNILGAV